MNHKPQDEITLKQLIQILVNARWIIIGFIVVGCLAAFIYSFIIAAPTFESKAVLNASPIGQEVTEVSDINSIVENSGIFPVSTVETYMEQLLSPQLLTRVIDELSLVNDEGKRMTVGSLQSKIKVTNAENTNLLEITVTSKNKMETERIANTLAVDFIDFIDEAGQSQSLETASKIEEQLIIEESKLASKSQALADFMGESISISELKSEITSLITQITTIKADLNSIEVGVNSASEQLRVLAPSFKSSDLIIDSIHLDTEGIILSEGISITSQDNNKLAESLIVIEFINIQNTLISDKARREALLTQLSALESSLIDKQSLLVEEEYKYERLNRELQLAKQTYNAYQNRYQEAIVAAVAEIGSNNIVVSSEAITPENPTGPNKTLNLVLGLLVGSMIGIFTALFKAYWTTS